jgi:hypothetical protein
LLAVSVTVRVPLAAATAVGVKTIKTVQLVPPVSVLGLRGQVPPLCWKFPLTEIVLMDRGTVCTFLSVTVFAALVVPSA